ASMAILAVGAVVLVSGSVVLSLWRPTRLSLPVLCSVSMIVASALILAHARWAGWTASHLAAPELLAGAAAALMAAAVALMPRWPAAPVKREGGLVRPILQWVALASITALLLIALLDRDLDLEL